jgi:hypothetical protein
MSLGCSHKPKFSSGDFIIPEGKTDSSEILLVVGVSEDNYKVFTHFRSEGRLVQAEDYHSKDRGEIDNEFVKIQPPKIDGSFSPDKYLSDTKK